MVRAREAEAAARAAEKREVADRMYERVRREMEAAMKAREEEDQLINLLRQVSEGEGREERQGGRRTG
jgi:hypothetical protein